MKYLILLLIFFARSPCQAQPADSSSEALHLAEAYREQARGYARDKNYDQAIAAYQTVLRYAPKTGSRQLLMTALQQLGLLYEIKGNYPLALDDLKQSLDIRDSINFVQKAEKSSSEAYSHDFMLNVMGSLKQQTASIPGILKTIATKESLNDTLALSINYFNLGLLYKNKKMYPASLDALRSCLKFASKIHYRDMQGSALSELADLYSLMGNYKMSLLYLKKHMKHAATVDKDAKTIEELQTRYEITQREDQVLQQKFEITKRNYWVTGIAILIVLILIIVFIYYRQTQLRQRNIAMQAIIRTEESERRRIAQDLHDSVSQTMSAAKINLSMIGTELPFQNEEQERRFHQAVALVDQGFREVRTISHNMMPWALHKTGLAQVIRQFVAHIRNEAINVQFFSTGFEEPFDDTIEIILYRVLQESVNNVMKHAAADRIDISLMRDEQNISLTIEDNGRGFDSSGPGFQKGMGMHNLQSRINFLNGQVEFDSQPGKGTLVSVCIPLRQPPL